jgi:hypothetical protein
MNKERLLKAADWAQQNIRPEMFDMTNYRKGQANNPVCDSVGCMVGHLTAIDAENVVVNYIGYGSRIRFTDWALNYFDVNYEEWVYLFPHIGQT